MGKMVFIHPDLGIGGAERAMIDAALALKSRGHQVEFVTSHHDPSHCFQETKDGTFKVTSVGDWLPRKILNRFYALSCIPFLKLGKSKIVFYCHFPDMLLTHRTSFFKRLYRAPIDFLEERTTGMADCVLVNSKFTASVFNSTFTSLRHIQPEVLYPIPDFAALDKPVEPPTDDLVLPFDAQTVFLSINRYERKKNLRLAVEAFGNLLQTAPSADVHLIMAGGYDPRVSENVEYHKELVELARDIGVDHKVAFLRSFTDSQKRTLLKHSSCLVYTPENEHFGIVPIEAMYMECPVIAMRSGGPLETVADGATGFLCQNAVEKVSEAMLKFVRDPEMGRRLGSAGKKRVTSMFSFVEFTEKLDTLVSGLVQG